MYRHVLLSTWASSAHRVDCFFCIGGLQRIHTQAHLRMLIGKDKPLQSLHQIRCEADGHIVQIKTLTWWCHYITKVIKIPSVKNSPQVVCESNLTHLIVNWPAAADTTDDAYSWINTSLKQFENTEHYHLYEGGFSFSFRCLMTECMCLYVYMYFKGLIFCISCSNVTYIL